MTYRPYLTAAVTPNGNLKLTANNDAMAWLKEQQGRTDLEILRDGLEGYWNNGSFEPFDAGDANPFVGLSNAPCIAESMDLDDDGTKSIHGRFWYYSYYMLKSFVEQLKNRGFVYFHALQQGDTMTEWKLAAGSCGFNIGATPVEGAYVNGVALFSWYFGGHHVCVVTGHGSCGGSTADAAKVEGVRRAETEDPRDADRKLSKKQFDATIADPARHD